MIFDKIIKDLLQLDFFSEYKFRKRDSSFLLKTKDAGKKFQLANVKDINTAKGTEYVVGMGKGIVYRYDKNGVNAVFPINIAK